MPELVASIEKLRASLAPLRRAEKTIGFVPTMGALHRGHQRLLERARTENDILVASIFVNPSQFDRQEDLEAYPRTLEEDLALCRAAGVDFVFAPSSQEMYPQRQLAWVEVTELDENLCGRHRPGHFRGVATVVLKLLQIVQPQRAYFGEKDAQQLAIIKRMVADLNIPVEIVPVATVREADGLALSSRNKHLSEEERRVATVLSRALFTAGALIEVGERSPQVVQAAVEPLFAKHSDVRLEYFSVVHPATLAPVEIITGRVLIAAALWIGTTRLIDNVTADPKREPTVL